MPQNSNVVDILTHFYITDPSWRATASTNFFGGGGGGVSYPLCLSSSSALHFSDYSFCVHHLVNQYDWHLLAHAMASDFLSHGSC
jgi:hypothetical protein